MMSTTVKEHLIPSRSFPCLNNFSSIMKMSILNLQPTTFVLSARLDSIHRQSWSNTFQAYMDPIRVSVFSFTQGQNKEQLFDINL